MVLKLLGKLEGFGYKNKIILRKPILKISAIGSINNVCRCPRRTPTILPTHKNAEIISWAKMPRLGHMPIYSYVYVYECLRMPKFMPMSMSNLFMGVYECLCLCLLKLVCLYVYADGGRPSQV
jgi:hypothetical protein